MDLEFDRRDLLRGTLALPLAGSIAPVGARARTELDPNAAVELYVRVLGDTAGGRSYIQYDADIFALGDKRVPLPLVRARGIARNDWKRLGPHSYHETSFDHGLVCDVETGRALDSFKNPLTGEDNSPLHYRSGPFAREIKPVNPDGTPFVIDWQLAGGAVWFTERAAGKRANWLSPAQFPRASTGPEVYLATSATYLVEEEFIADRARTAIPATNFWTFVANYPAWMMMGEAPGFVLWRWVARKITRYADLDPYLVAEITRRVPDYFTSEAPWTEYSNGWIQYARERSGEAPGS